MRLNNSKFQRRTLNAWRVILNRVDVRGGQNAHDVLVNTWLRGHEAESWQSTPVSVEWGLLVLDVPGL